MVTIRILTYSHNEDPPKFSVLARKYGNLLVLKRVEDIDSQKGQNLPAVIEPVGSGPKFEHFLCEDTSVFSCHALIRFTFDNVKILVRCEIDAYTEQSTPSSKDDVSSLADQLKGLQVTDTVTLSSLREMKFWT